MEHKLTGMDSTFAGVIKVRYTFEPGRTLTDSELFGTTSISKGKTLWRKVSVAVGMSAMAKGQKTKPASVYSVQQDSSDILSKNISNGPVEEHDPLSEKLVRLEMMAMEMVPGKKLIMIMSFNQMMERLPMKIKY